MSKYAPILDAKLTYLYSRTGGSAIKLGLDTISALLRVMKVDPLQLPCVHVAGTNGKGSVSAMIESVLREAGLHTALYTSPHLIRFNERIRIRGEMIPDDELLRLLDLVEKADQTQAAEAEGRRLGTFFELTTAVAFAWFLAQKVQLAVLETGMGGRLDSTNVVTPLLAVLTSVGMEHKSFLGRTLEKIAAEKAGVIKPGRPVVTGRQSPAVMRVIADRAREVGAPLILAEERVSIRRTSQDLDGQMLSVETAAGGWAPFRLPLLGDFQLENCALAIAALEWLREELHLPLPPDVIREGLAKTRWPGRCQVVSRDPVFLVDVAHNPGAAQALANFLKSFRGDRPVALICGMLADKDAEGFFKILRPVVDACVLVPLDSERNMPMEKLMAAAKAAKLPAAEGLLPSAVKNAKAWAQKNNGIVVAAGSLYMASAVLYELGYQV
ncbi:MAG TPA: folylpolyglutamate synthase/dihydrofolate synthase family protein [Kiritimatiellia bacterium]|nr:folylpolyglutamate synthase/dihydrofolate synthase family protein [Kiritimatiellia bacterium]HOR73599.1 folylpolyglutamate synthase/dihydrofolate synthase family protein [Kiritimatiellia bacterium]HPK69086.1 folylpolyglutamate synthase/dihydrofolate synthase family protein [Kiritimatiellia bacterium]HPV46522.1 folylpolyglutamate synthase/dihydrofolate synthase family protein [Kiritimatiellia bacterium]HPY62055.1 folylpolyglutamate synthase/dihydrofolate synthase family protein [Kiritimatiell